MVWLLSFCAAGLSLIFLVQFIQLLRESPEEGVTGIRPEDRLATRVIPLTTRKTAVATVGLAFSAWAFLLPIPGALPPLLAKSWFELRFGSRAASHFAPNPQFLAPESPEFTDRFEAKFQDWLKGTVTVQALNQGNRIRIIAPAPEADMLRLDFARPSWELYPIKEDLYLTRSMLAPIPAQDRLTIAGLAAVASWAGSLPFLLILAPAWALRRVRGRQGHEIATRMKLVAVLSQYPASQHPPARFTPASRWKRVFSADFHAGTLECGGQRFQAACPQEFWLEGEAVEGVAVAVSSHERVFIPRSLIPASTVAQSLGQGARRARVA